MAIYGKEINRAILRNKKFDTIKKYKDDELHRPGIYAIVNIKNGNVYIGQSRDLVHRRYEHFLLLKRGKHQNPHLQNAYNFYGSINFKFVVLELVDDRRVLDEREQFWIDTTPSAYNIIKDIAEGVRAAHRFMFDKTHPDGGYIKDGESFIRPAWHKWVYGGERNPQV